MAKLNPGDRFPDFTFQTAKGETLKVSEVLRRKQKTVFWVLRYIGCTTCRYDIQVISEKYPEFLSRNAQVLVVLQSPRETVLEEMAKAEAAGHGFAPGLDIICDPDFAIYSRFSIEAAPDKERLLPSSPDEVAKLNAKREKVKAAGIVHGKYEGEELQLPALFIVGQDGVVVEARYAKNLIDMPTPDELLARL
ncbi:MAG: redoxin domain-containing protein [Synergistaceae bacterium]|jgi:peroxiredoxin|nr:redoxin domain-containing protein [Synergistaceae bacterium]